MVFCSIILLLLAAYFIYVQKSRANLSNFPKSSQSGFIYNIAFVIFVMLIAYILVLFWLKLNIVQTILALLVIILPGSVVVFKAMSHINIDV